MKDVTGKYINMIEAFECDFSLAVHNKKDIAELDSTIKNKDEKLLKDIELLKELSFLLRNNKIKIVEQ